MSSKAILCAATALLLISGTFAQTQSSFTSTAGGTGSSSTSSSSSAFGFSTSAEEQQQQGGGAFQTQEPEASDVSLPTDTRQVDSFSTIALCAPINLRVSPNTESNDSENAYTFTVTAEEEILSQIQTEVGPEGVLAITATGPFATNQTVQMTASLPTDALNSILHSGPGETFL